jgi:hypothetical protein
MALCPIALMWLNDGNCDLGYIPSEVCCRASCDRPLGALQGIINLVLCVVTFVLCLGVMIAAAVAVDATGVAASHEGQAGLRRDFVVGESLRSSDWSWKRIMEGDIQPVGGASCCLSS